MDLRDISMAIKQASDAIRANEKFAVPVLAARARKAAQECPHDAPLVLASQVLTKMASDKTFISRTELNKLYDRLYSQNTKLAEVFSEELDRKPLPTPKVFERSPDEGSSLDRDYNRVADPLLSNALNAAFDGQYKPYSAKIASAAERSCLKELNAMGVPPKKIDVFAGQSDLIICKATYETPKGQSNVLVPVEIQGDCALLPTIFISEAGATDLSRQAMEAHILSTAGNNYHIDGEKLLQALSAAKNGIPKIASVVEMAAMKVQADSEEPPQNMFAVYSKLEEPVPDVQLPELPKDPETLSFAQRLAQPDGIARQVFGNNTVDAGRNMISKRMSRMGYRNVQVKVADVTDDTIYYVAGMGANTGLKIPVSVKNGLVQPLTVAIASGKVKEFSQAGVEELMANPDGKLAAVTSAAYGMRPTELIERVREAAADGNLVKAEDAINVLGTVDPAAQKVAIGILMQALSGEDESPELTKQASEVTDVPYFMTHKVFFPEGV